MKSCLNNAVKMLALAAAMSLATSASAQSAGQWTGKLGVNKITPRVSSGDISAPALPGTKGDVGPDTEPTFSIGYGLTDNIALELGLGVPYKHNIYGAGAIEGVGKLGSVKVLPPTLFVQYRLFEPSAMFRPYLGVGATFAYFRDATGSGAMTATTNPGAGTPTTFSIDNQLAATIQGGLTINITPRFFADISVTRTYLQTDVKFSSGQTQAMTLNPESVSIGIGYKF